MLLVYKIREEICVLDTLRKVEYDCVWALRR